MPDWPGEGKDTAALSWFSTHSRLIPHSLLSFPELLAESRRFPPGVAHVLDSLDVEMVGAVSPSISPSPFPTFFCNTIKGCSGDFIWPIKLYPLEASTMRSLLPTQSPTLLDKWLAWVLGTRFKSLQKTGREGSGWLSSPTLGLQAQSWVSLVTGTKLAYWDKPLQG